MKLWFFGARNRPLMAGPDDGPVAVPASGSARADPGRAARAGAQAMPVRVLRGPGAVRHRLRRIEARLARARTARERDRARGHGREALEWWDHEIRALEAERTLYRLKLDGDWKP